MITLKCSLNKSIISCDVKQPYILPLGSIDKDTLSESLKDELDNKVDKESGKGLSTNDYTDTDKAEVAKVKDKVGFTDYANDIKGGVVRIRATADDTGLWINDYGILSIVAASEDEIDSRSTIHPITPDLLDYAVRSVRPEVSYNPPTFIGEPYKVNTIYSLDSISNVDITLPNDAQCGDFIQVDFYTANKTTLSITSNAGISDVGLTPELNTAYSLYFDWGILYYNTSKSEYVFGWRFSYAEYPHKEV